MCCDAAICCMHLQSVMALVISWTLESVSSVNLLACYTPPGVQVSCPHGRHLLLVHLPAAALRPAGHGLHLGPI